MRSTWMRWPPPPATARGERWRSATLQTLSESNRGAFAEQVRLSAAQTALGAGQYDAAASLADGVPATSGAGAQALLTKAWALYRGGNAGGAATAFREFATRYPYLPARDEARLMAGQIMLESGKSDSAEKYFQGVADSIGGELSALQSRAATAMNDASRALVTARVAGSVLVANAAPGKVIVLPDDAGAENRLVAAAFAGTEDSASASSSPQTQLERRNRRARRFRRWRGIPDARGVRAARGCADAGIVRRSHAGGARDGHSAGTRLVPAAGRDRCPEDEDRRSRESAAADLRG